ncbi:MAG: hypothetical protein ACK5PG_05125 [Lysobacterales bacterium]|jgi:hypothetical protein
MHIHPSCTFAPLLLLGLLSVPVAEARAEGVRWALCELDAGCRFCTLPITHVQADVALSALGLIRDAPGHTVTVLRNRAGEWTWYYDTRRTPAELHSYFGGQGAPVEGACPGLPEAVQPRDGHWRLAPSPAQSKNCPAGLDAQLQAQLPLPGAGEIRFQRPFQASDTLPVAAWVPVAPNRQVGVFAPAGADGLRGIYSLDVVSEDAMRGELRVIAPIPGQASCEVTISFEYRREGAAS